MRITNVKVTTAGTKITALYQNAEDERINKITFENNDTNPVNIIHALQELQNEAKEISELSDDSSIEIKGTTVKYKDAQTIVQLSIYRHVDGDKGYSFSTPKMYDVHEDDELILPEEFMSKLSTVRSEALKYLKHHTDQMGLSLDA